MTNFNIFLRYGKWYGNEFPALDLIPTDHPLMREDVLIENAKRKKRHEAAIETAKSTSLEIVNPEVYAEKTEDGSWFRNPFPGSILTESIQIKPGELYLWDGKVEKHEKRRYRFNGGDWSRWYDYEPDWVEGFELESQTFFKLLPKQKETLPSDLLIEQAREILKEKGIDMDKMLGADYFARLDQRKKIVFCDKCGEAYQTANGHECHYVPEQKETSLDQNDFDTEEEFFKACREQRKGGIVATGEPEQGEPVGFDFCFPWRYQEQADKYTHIIRGNSNQHLLQGRQNPNGYEEALYRMIVERVNAYDPLRDQLAYLNKFHDTAQVELTRMQEELAKAKEENRELSKQREEIIGIVYGDGSAQERLQAVKITLNIQP